MNIGYFSSEFLYPRQYENHPYGGVTKAACNLAVELANMGHRIDDFTTSREAR